jgi:hypothetical protein
MTQTVEGLGLNPDSGRNIPRKYPVVTDTQLEGVAETEVSGGTSLIPEGEPFLGLYGQPQSPQQRAPASGMARPIHFSTRSVTALRTARGLVTRSKGATKMGKKDTKPTSKDQAMTGGVPGPMEMDATAYRHITRLNYVVDVCNELKSAVGSL